MEAISYLAPKTEERTGGQLDSTRISLVVSVANSSVPHLSSTRLMPMLVALQRVVSLPESRDVA